MSRTSTPASTIRKAVLLAGAITVALVLILRYQRYESIVTQAERLTLSSLENAVWSIAQLIDGDEHQQLQEAYLVQDEISALNQEVLYDQLHAKLAQAYKQLGFETPIYTYTTAESSNTLAFIGTSAPEPYFRHPLSSAPEEQVASYGESMTLPIYSDGHGTWLSACAPIFNSNGNVVAMVQVDRSFDRFISEAEEEAFTGLWWNIVMILCLVVMVWKYVSNLVIKEEQDKIALQVIIKEKTLLSERLAKREEELERQKAMLVDKNQYLEDFANIASHDLKSPLRGISNFAGLLARRLGTTTESSVTEYIDYIQTNSKRALKLVDGILSYSKLGAEAQNNTSCNLNEVASNAIENLQSIIELRNVQVELNVSLPSAVCDQVLVTQLFQNLIGNGIKYNESAVPVIRVDCVSTKNGGCVFSVTDNGIGIPKQYQDSVFEMFKRLHGGDKYEGSGIGLAFCARIINSYGGEIWLESEEGEGATFFFTLPNAFVESRELV